MASYSGIHVRRPFLVPSWTFEGSTPHFYQFQPWESCCFSAYLLFSAVSRSSAARSIQHFSLTKDFFLRLEGGESSAGHSQGQSDAKWPYFGFGIPSNARADWDLSSRQICDDPQRFDRRRTSNGACLHKTKLLLKGKIPVPRKDLCDMSKPFGILILMDQLSLVNTMLLTKDYPPLRNNIQERLTNTMAQQLLPWPMITINCSMGYEENTMQSLPGIKNVGYCW